MLKTYSSLDPFNVPANGPCTLLIFEFGMFASNETSCQPNTWQCAKSQAPGTPAKYRQESCKPLRWRPRGRKIHLPWLQTRCGRRHPLFVVVLLSFFCVGHWLVLLGKTEAAGFIYESFWMSKSFRPIPRLNSRQLTNQTPSENIQSDGETRCKWVLGKQIASQLFTNLHPFVHVLYPVISGQLLCKGPRSRAYRMSWLQVYKMGGFLIFPRKYRWTKKTLPLAKCLPQPHFPDLKLPHFCKVGSYKKMIWKCLSCAYSDPLGNATLPVSCPCYNICMFVRQGEKKSIHLQ